MKKNLRIKYSLKSKLSLSYAAVFFLCIFFISMVANIYLDKYFREYVQENQEQRNKEIVAAVSNQYRINGDWNMDAIETVGINALESRMIIRIVDNDGQIIWDAKTHNNGMCNKIIEQMAKNMNSRYPNLETTYMELSYPVINVLTKVGYVEIGSYHPFFLSDQDLVFINALNKLLIIMGIISLFLALILGNIMSKRISLPISRVINAAQQISQGNFSDRISEKSDTKEISQLTNTINNLAETLEKQETLRKRISADVAHELRTPLTTLQSHIEAMIDGIWEPKTKRLKNCHEEIVRINKLVGDLENLAKYESNNIILHKTNFNMLKLLYQIRSNFEPEYRSKEISINIIGSMNTWIYADQDKISQLIINLLSNAIKYTPSGGSIVLNVKETQEQIEIIVNDSGEGIPKEDLAYVFERFYRADKSRNRMTGGTGIGLSISKAIVEAHNGMIEVKSELNVGTTFTVFLPK